MRDHRLRERRLRLGLSQAALACLCDRRLHQAQVSAAETAPAAHPGYVDALRRCLTKLELERRLERTVARHRREFLEREEERVAFQRSLWAALPDHPAVRALKAAMLGPVS